MQNHRKQFFEKEQINARLTIVTKSIFLLKIIIIKNEQIEKLLLLEVVNFSF